MSKSTRATKALEAAKHPFTLAAYEYDPDADSIGLAAAAALAAPPETVFKTLMILADGKPACVIAPSDHEVSMKKAAAALKAKSAIMMDGPQAERLSGYKIGGISPFGQARKLPVVIDHSALLHPTIFVNGGQRGLQICLTPQVAIAALSATVAEISQRPAKSMT